MISKVREPIPVPEVHVPQVLSGDSNITSKLILKDKEANYVIGDQGYFLKGLRRELDVHISVF